MKIPRMRTKGWRKNLTRGVRHLQACHIRLEDFAAKAHTSRTHIYRHIRRECDVTLKTIGGYERAFAHFAKYFDRK